MIARLLLLAAVCFLAAPDSHAQARWAQTVQVVADVHDEHVMSVLRDSLAHLAASGQMTVRRLPDGSATTHRALESDLHREGLDFWSANQVFVTYHLEASPRGFASTIQSFHFIYRPQGYEGIDVPILYVDASEAAVRRLVLSGGTRLAHNEAAFEPFADQVSFARLADSAVVSVGGRVIRDPEDGAAERERLLATIRRFMY
jgi:hypothetical protein